MIDIGKIRNFSVIAHINHGKSTLSDRFIEHCQGVDERDRADQMLDSMDLERERGITIKSQSVTLNYSDANQQQYQLNLIDTPGHVDFSYEVSRSLAACEGALLVVDATQGVEAQTLANCLIAMEQGLEILPVLNKIDLERAEPDRVRQEIEQVIGLPTDDLLEISAKTGLGVEALMARLVTQIPPPSGDRSAVLKALIIDSWFDRYQGVVCLVRVLSGTMRTGNKIMMYSLGATYKITSLGVYTPKELGRDYLAAGEVGFVVAAIKDINGAPVGDTIVDAAHPDTEPLAGFERIKPQVYAGLFPTESDQFEDFREALSKLSLNDAALVYEPESSDVLGFGFRCGFLGMLHMEIVQERLEREYQLDLITTAPTVIYEVHLRDGSVQKINSPSRLPRPELIDYIAEPLVLANILVPESHLGNVISLCIERRGEQKEMNFYKDQVSLSFILPMAEVVSDFFDRLKSVSQGYASLDYSFLRFTKASLVRVSLLVNGEPIDTLTMILHKHEAQSKGRMLAEKMKDLIPRQMFDIAVQAAIGGKIIARTTVKALRKNVTAKCYGGDVTRKKKLLSKQSAGKKRMKRVGKVSIPQEAFLAALRME